MSNLIDFCSMGIIVVLASVFLYKTFRKSSGGCSSNGCSSCSSGCNENKVRQFKSIQIKSIN